MALFWASGIKERDADLRIAKAHAEAAAAQAEAARANEGLALAGERAAKYKSEAAIAQLEVERIRQTLQWRELTPEQSTALTKAFIGVLAKYNKNMLLYVYDEPEVINYATGIFNAIKAAGYSSNRTPVVRFQLIIGLATNVGILVADEPLSEARALHAAFAEAGIDAPLAHLQKMENGRRAGTGELMVEIWRKPLPSHSP